MHQRKNNKINHKRNGGSLYIRALSIFMLFLLMATSVQTAYGLTYGAVSDLQALGVIDDGSVETLRLRDSMTRAEFAKVVVCLSGMAGLEPSGTGPFADVPAAHWAAGYIAVCKDRGLVNGMEDGLFYPENKLLLQDAVKVIIHLLGYERQSAARGGYPGGYLAQAAVLKLTEGGLEGEFAQTATRADVFQLAANALDVAMLQETGVSQTGSILAKNDDNTLRNLLLQNQDLTQGSGLVTATYWAYVTRPNAMIRENEVEIDGVRYQIGNTAAETFLGQRVVFTSHEDAQSGEKTLRAVSGEKQVEALSVTDRDFESCSAYTLRYTSPEDGKSKTAEINPGAAILYNNRPVLSADQIDVTNGYIQLYDNDGDGLYDVVLVYDYVSLPVESVNVKANRIQLKDGLTFGGRSIISVDRDDKNMQVQVSDENGTIALSEAENCNLVTFMESRDGTYRGVILTNQTVEGTITEAGDDFVVIDGTRYETEKGGSLWQGSLPMGQEVCAALNHRGRVAYIEATDASDSRYGYIIAVKENSMGSNRQVKMLTAGTVSMIEEDPDNDPSTDNNEKVLVAQNGGIGVFSVADSLRIDGVKLSEAGGLPVGKVVEYKLNANGCITKLTTPVLADNDRKKYYDATDNVFGKTLGEPFGIDETSVVLCIPANSVSGDDDYLATVKMNDGQQYTVSGYDMKASDCNVKLLTIEENMVYDDLGVIGATTKIALVKQVSTVLDEEGSERIRVVLLTENMEKLMLAADYADSSRLRQLGAGDVIYYSQNGRNEIVNYRRIAQLSQSSDYYVTGGNTSDERAFGYLDNIAENRISALRNRRVHRLTVQTDSRNSDNTTVYDAQLTYPPAVFVYDPARNTAANADLSDLRLGEEVFIQSVNGVVTGIVCIRR